MNTIIKSTHRLISRPNLVILFILLNLREGIHAPTTVLIVIFETLLHSDDDDGDYYYYCMQGRLEIY
jgi:hypothetical protein